MTGKWGPWIEHDGADPILPRLRLRLQVKWCGWGITPAHMDQVTRGYPGFFWRWRTVKTGWLRSEKRRVCDDPAYCPITRYRILRPKALVDLIEMAENLPAPAAADAGLNPAPAGRIRVGRLPGLPPSLDLPPVSCRGPFSRGRA
jgi:hypothetical protein